MSENKESKFNKVKYDNDFQKNNYDRINLLVKKGKKEELKYIVASMAIKV